MKNRNNPFRKMRGVTDQQLGLVLDNHAMTLRGMIPAVSALLRERRLLLVLQAVQVAVIIWLVLSR